MLPRKAAVLVLLIAAAIGSDLAAFSGPAAAASYPTTAYIAVTRAGAAVYVNGLVKQESPDGIIRSPGRTVYLQRDLAGSWQDMLTRTTSADGQLAVGFITEANLYYRLYVAPSGGATADLSAPAAPAGTPPGPVSTGHGTSTLPYQHVFYVMFENQNYASIIGNAHAPYLNSLAKAGALAVNAHAISHPSLVNYLAAVAGQKFAATKINDNCTVTLTSCSTNAPNLTDRLEAKGLTWKAYMESMPTPCYKPHLTGLYAERHNPFLYFNQIRTNPARCANDVPYTQLAVDLRTAASTPNFVWITPNLCDDMHNACPPASSVTNGDTWARRQLSALFASPAWTSQSSLLIITEDENAGATGNQIPVIFLASNRSITPGTKAGAYYTHYSVLRTLDTLFNVAPVGPGDTAAAPMTAMFSQVP